MLYFQLARILFLPTGHNEDEQSAVIIPQYIYISVILYVDLVTFCFAALILRTVLTQGLNKE